jgi:hypothetical protein
VERKKTKGKTVIAKEKISKRIKKKKADDG